MRRSINELAAQELIDAVLFYDQERQGLGSALIEEFEHCMEMIDLHPAAGESVQGECRRRLLRRFPYALFYRVRGQDGSMIGEAMASLVVLSWIAVGVLILNNSLAAAAIIAVVCVACSIVPSFRRLLVVVWCALIVWMVCK